MPVERTAFVQTQFEFTEEYARVTELSDALLAHLNEPHILNAIAVANAPGASSSLVQNTFVEFARDLGFTDEAQGLFANYPTPGLRPDYFMAVGDSGIILEVERGKTTINNMDMLDMWKCHICPHADYLFLMVPSVLVQGTRPATKPYPAVVKRLSSFFNQGNYAAVRGLHIFGY